MKKILIVLILCCLCIPAIADEDLLSWEKLNSVPSAYLKNDLSYIENKTFYYNHPYLSYLGCYTIVGIPFILHSASKSGKVNENNYWVARKKEFEIQKNLCNKIKDNDKKTECLINLRQEQNRITSIRQQNQIQNYYQAQQVYYQRQQYYNNNRPTTYTVNPVGNTYYVNKY